MTSVANVRFGSKAIPEPRTALLWRCLLSVRSGHSQLVAERAPAGSALGCDLARALLRDLPSLSFAGNQSLFFQATDDVVRQRFLLPSE